MSVWYTQGLACPVCGASIAAKLARAIHAVRVPAVRAAILAGQLHRIACPRCAAATIVHRELVYTDFARHHWVHLAVPEDRARWPEIERGARALFDRALRRTAPLLAARADAFTFRIGFDLGELREKLILWDAGLDDRLVECAKLACARERPALLGRGRRLRVDAVGATGELEVAVLDADLRTAGGIRIPRDTVDQIAAARADWEGRLPELFAGGFVSVDRLLA